ncbi:MAG: hypothetical protein EBS70_08085 [Actinobacteria bacterium]|nr:hypothetical protein [Actinomycetota bacterium]
MEALSTATVFPSWTMNKSWRSLSTSANVPSVVSAVAGSSTVSSRYAVPGVMLPVGFSLKYFWNAITA